MNDFDIPIFKKIYELYKTFHGLRALINKQDRYTVWQKSEETILEILEHILSASQAAKADKPPLLQKASVKLNLLRVFIRLMKDARTLDNKKYTALESLVDEIGRMLGGWIKSVKEL
ncbi:MAG: four helix bundle protein [Candidatus Jorgensenbacteria bacterium]